ncbi:MAG: DNA repair protein RadA, partial [Dehalococcoidales bacterium]|nr:DNA repair protein RadA [Dehalococcoidales bacterium]
MSRREGKTVFVCQECGRESPRWLGRCPDCQGWNTFVEVAVRQPPARSPDVADFAGAVPQPLAALKTEAVERHSTPITELNRVLGGGVVGGSVVLIAGEPGIGKSTLLLQIAGALARQENPVVYASGEETAHQIKIR